MMMVILVLKDNGSIYKIMKSNTMVGGPWALWLGPSEAGSMKNIVHCLLNNFML